MVATLIKQEEIIFSLELTSSDQTLVSFKVFVQLCGFVPNPCIILHETAILGAELNIIWHI